MKLKQFTSVKMELVLVMTENKIGGDNVHMY